MWVGRETGKWKGFRYERKLWDRNKLQYRGAIPKYFCSSIPTGGVACSRRNRKPRVTCIRIAFQKKKKKLLYHRGWRRDFSLSWNRRFPHAFHFLRFSPKLYYSHCSLFEASSSKQSATIISISSGNNFISRFYFLAIESRFLDFIRRSVVSVAARTATSLGKIVRASTHHGYSIHPVTQEISRFIRGKAAIGRTNPPLR